MKIYIENTTDSNIHPNTINMPESALIKQTGMLVARHIDDDKYKIAKAYKSGSKKKAIDMIDDALLASSKSSTGVNSDVYKFLANLIHERSAVVSTTDDPYEFEDYYYSKIYERALEIILDETGY